jgi:hypothetical protein
MRKMVSKKNNQIRQLREALMKYEPEAVAAIAVEDEND